MAYTLKNIYEKFEKENLELNRIITELAGKPESVERDCHIEGCFIRLVVGWECFVEEYFLRCMCKAKTRSNYEIKPQTRASKNINEAFKKINKNRKDREKDFTDWLDGKQLQQRVDDHFRKNSRVQKICESPDRLFELRTIRNAIAHRSPSAIAKFEKYVKDQMGYLSSLQPTMASLLVQKRRNSNDFIFTILSNYFLGLADRLTK
ncbi:hypothetical protein HJ202_24775 [Vibrio parahaemolyticus]|uniref:hypothetical protein n=1 Tax=Vibrio parahaemolyticus TaxID=670 RepID=UPI0004DB71E9|nr:hypothetical protein [Vibrio parahaemolyticus]EJG0942881.1 hypothetical protein [Vibrio parahaemolyticus O1]EKO3573736.1 hypothetical protein [Vibrio metschnikovii]MBY8057992.1 hypothetical protein [Vibrio fluvialis]EGQ8541458.1 hypothetical protein [Vibrio parahaemolyticus]EGR2744638.1 hypothetical protein [Vibrio parahaemolyticus]